MTEYPPFNLEAAKRGEPVIQRCGLPARILAFDLRGRNKIAYIAEMSRNNLVLLCDEYGRRDGCSDPQYFDPPDLFMAPNKSATEKIKWELECLNLPSIKPRIFESLQEARDFHKGAIHDGLMDGDAICCIHAIGRQTRTVYRVIYRDGNSAAQRDFVDMDSAMAFSNFMNGREWGIFRYAFPVEIYG